MQHCHTVGKMRIYYGHSCKTTFVTVYLNDKIVFKSENLKTTYHEEMPLMYAKTFLNFMATKFADFCSENLIIEDDGFITIHPKFT